MKLILYLILSLPVFPVLPVFAQYQSIFTDDANTLAHWEFNNSYTEIGNRFTTSVQGSWTPTFVELQNGVFGLQASGDATKYLYVPSGQDTNLRLPASGDTYTVEFVVVLDTVDEMLIFDHSSGTFADGWSLNLWSAANFHKIRFGVYDNVGSSSSNTVMTGAPEDSNLYYICVYLDYGDSLTMYINNIKQVSGDLSSIADVEKTVQANIGQWKFLATLPFRGQIYGIRISSILRTANERSAVWSFLQDIPEIETQKKKKYNGRSGFNKY